MLKKKNPELIAILNFGEASSYHIEFVKLLRICYRCIFFPNIYGIPALTFNNCPFPLSFVL